MSTEIFHQMITRSQSHKLVALGYAKCSDEALEYIFLYIGYEHRQRLVRVCRRWMAIITNRLNHIYVSLNMFKTFMLGIMDEQTSRNEKIRPVPSWKYYCKAVQRMTYDGHYCTLLIGRTCQTMDVLSKRYPCLSELNIIRVQAAEPVLPYEAEKYNIVTLKNVRENSPSVKITIHSQFVNALPCKLTGLCCPQHLTQLIQRHFSRSRLRIPDMALGDYDDYLRAVDDAIWPYPAEQTQWLACHAPKLNLEEKGVQEIIRVISSKDRSRHGYIRATNRPCDEHEKFCEHLDFSYYQNTLDGHSKLILALCFYHLGIPGVGHPPFPLVFYELEPLESTFTMVMQAPLAWL